MNGHPCVREALRLPRRAARIEVPVQRAGALPEQHVAVRRAAQALLDVLGRQLRQRQRIAGVRHGAHHRFATDHVQAAARHAGGSHLLFDDQVEPVAHQLLLREPDLAVLLEAIERLHVGSHAGSDLAQEVRLFRRHREFLAAQLVRERQVAPHVGQRGDARRFLLVALERPRQFGQSQIEFAELLVVAGDVAQQHVNQHLGAAARTGAVDFHVAPRHSAAFGHADAHFVGDDFAVGRFAEDDGAAGDDAVLRARHGHGAAAGVDHRIGRHARDRDRTHRVMHAAAHQVPAQHHRAAARMDIAVHIAVHRDVAAGDVALLLDVAVFLVGAGQFQVARGAPAHALHADDLVGHRNAVGLGVHAEKTFARGDQVFAVIELADLGAVAGQVAQRQVGGRRRRRHAPCQVEARQARRGGHLFQQPHAGRDLRKAVFKAVQVDTAVRARARRIAAMERGRYFKHGGVLARFRFQVGGKGDAIGPGRIDGGRHGCHVDAELDALVPHGRDEFVDVEPRRTFWQHGAVGQHFLIEKQRLEIVFGVAASELGRFVQRHAAGFDQPHAIGQAHGLRVAQCRPHAVQCLDQHRIMEAGQAKPGAKHLVDGGNQRGGRQSEYPHKKTAGKSGGGRAARRPSCGPRGGSFPRCGYFPAWRGAAPRRAPRSCADRPGAAGRGCPAGAMCRDHRGRRGADRPGLLPAPVALPPGCSTAVRKPRTIERKKMRLLPRQDYGSGRRRAAARPVAPLSDRTGVQRVHRRKRHGHEQAVAARALRPAGAGPDAARRRRPVDLPPPARRRRPDAHHHADGQRRGRGPHRGPGNGRRRLPAQAIQSARAGGAHRRRAAPPRPRRDSGRAIRNPANLRVRPVRAGPGHAHAQEKRRDRAAHHRRILGPQGIRPPCAPAAVARKADGTGARPRIRSVRPQPRRADLAPAQADRTRSIEPAVHPDRVGPGLRVHPGGSAALRRGRAHEVPAEVFAQVVVHAPSRQPEKRFILAYLHPAGRPHHHQHDGVGGDDQRRAARSAGAADFGPGSVGGHHHPRRPHPLGARAAARAAVRPGVQRRHPRVHAGGGRPRRSAARQRAHARHPETRARQAGRRYALLVEGQWRLRLLGLVQDRRRPVLADARARTHPRPHRHPVARMGQRGVADIAAGRGPDFKPDGQSAAAGGVGPRRDPGRHFARPAHAARAHAARSGNGAPVERSARGHPVRHRADGRHHRPVPRLRQAHRSVELYQRRPHRTAGRHRARRRAPARCAHRERHRARRARHGQRHRHQARDQQPGGKRPPLRPHRRRGLHRDRYPLQHPGRARSAPRGDRGAGPRPGCARRPDPPAAQTLYAARHRARPGQRRRPGTGDRRPRDAAPRRRADGAQPRRRRPGDPHRHAGVVMRSGPVTAAMPAISAISAISASSTLSASSSSTSSTSSALSALSTLCVLSALSLSAAPAWAARPAATPLARTAQPLQREPTAQERASFEAFFSARQAATPQGPWAVRPLFAPAFDIERQDRKQPWRGARGRALAGGGRAGALVRVAGHAQRAVRCGAVHHADGSAGAGARRGGAAAPAPRAAHARAPAVCGELAMRAVPRPHLPPGGNRAGGAGGRRAADVRAGVRERPQYGGAAGGGTVERVIGTFEQLGQQQLGRAVAVQRIGFQSRGFVRHRFFPLRTAGIVAGVRDAPGALERIGAAQELRHGPVGRIEGIGLAQHAPVAADQRHVAHPQHLDGVGRAQRLEFVRRRHAIALGPEQIGQHDLAAWRQTRHQAGTVAAVKQWHGKKTSLLIRLPHSHPFAARNGPVRYKPKAPPRWRLAAQSRSVSDGASNVAHA
uniref:Uncharacterized protein n=1 Tax=Tanacetum cinerariifolium TaxID=118510 RepID=A0A699GHX2_TANCI|nr:hypothetical protein [Tanacetum cinerariifolium]